MGIPSYFSFIVRNHPSIIRKYNKCAIFWARSASIGAVTSGWSVKMSFPIEMSTVDLIFRARTRMTLGRLTTRWL